MKSLIKAHPFILSFGILQIFFTAPGQTFLFALLIPHIMQSLEVSATTLALVYGVATFTASIMLTPAGNLIDRYPVKYVLICSTLLMSIGCAEIAISTSLFDLFIGFFLVRLLGQGVFGLTSGTLITKSFFKNRGKALSITTLGFPLSEMVYPLITLSLIASFGWRYTYLLFALTTLMVMLPIQIGLVRKSKLKHGKLFPDEWAIHPQSIDDVSIQHHHPNQKQFTLKEVMKDVTFYVVLAAFCLPPMTMTGLFFHQN
ncbi:MAG: MFS transporter, partial [Candidatus Margulisbacteria bacterium]|nr:MFS transporter [Candidatus Margulisiibacteriota bacterium]